jgi:hypothetical protein
MSFAEGETYHLLMCYSCNDPQGALMALNDLTEDPFRAAVLLGTLAHAVALPLPPPRPDHAVTPLVVDRYGDPAPGEAPAWTVARLVAAAAADDDEMLRDLSLSVMRRDDDGESYAEIVSDLIPMAVRTLVAMELLPSASRN